jgi:hypothetical protein
LNDGSIVPERRASRRHPLHLPVSTLPQPDETTCGPTCLHAIYRFFGDDAALSVVIERMWRLEHGGTDSGGIHCDICGDGRRLVRGGAVAVSDRKRHREQDGDERQFHGRSRAGDLVRKTS